MITLWGRNNSINVQKAIWCLEELGLPYERREAGGPFGIVKTPEYRLMNPNSLVPVLDEDGFILWESNTIVRYLCAKYAAGTFWPEDPRARARADRWTDWQATNYYPAFHLAFHGLVRTPPEKRDLAAIETARLNTEQRMAVLDAHLSRQRYLGGEQITFAEFVLAPTVHRWLHMPVERRSHAHVERWYGELAARPATRNAFVLPIT